MFTFTLMLFFTLRKLQQTYNFYDKLSKLTKIKFTKIFKIYAKHYFKFEKKSKIANKIQKRQIILAAFVFLYFNISTSLNLNFF